MAKRATAGSLRREAVALLPRPERLIGFDVADAPPSDDDDGVAYRRECVARAVSGEGPTFASWTLALGEEGLGLFNRMPSRTWWVRQYDLRHILVRWGLRAVDGFVLCGAGAPAETVPVASHIDSPKIAPMMAEAVARLAKQRSIAEKWLFECADAAAIGLVPPAARAKGKPREYARAALQKLVAGGRADVVRGTAERYGLVVELADLLGHTGADAAATPTNPRAADRVVVELEVRKLEERLRRATPSSATYGELDRLCAIDSDRALFAVAALASKARSRPLRRRATQALGAVRARRGLSEEDLAVRMIPTLGLDAPEVVIGDKTLRLTTSPALEARIVGPDGSRASSLPRGASIAVKSRWDLLKKELRTLRRATSELLERRMIAGEAWSGESFRAHVVAHPLLVELARGLVFQAGRTLFRIAEDGTFAGADDDHVALDPALPVTIAHPLDIGPAALARWADRFADYELLQPFPQLGREAFRVVVREGRIAELEGGTMEAGRILGLERLGWERGHVDGGLTLRWLDRPLPDLRASISFEPGVRLDDVKSAPLQRLVQVRVSSADGVLPPRSLSEVARELRLAAPQ